MLGNGTPATTGWLHLTDQHRSEELDGDEAKFWADATRLVRQDLRGLNGQSSFYNAISSQYRNMSMSYGVVYTYEQTGPNGQTGVPVYQAVQPHDFYYRLNDMNVMTDCCLERFMTHDQMMGTIGVSTVPKDQRYRGKRNILQMVRFNPKGRTNPRDAEDFFFVLEWIDTTEREIIARRGFYSQPFHVMGWYRVPGSSYYVGPMFDALPDLVGSNDSRKALKKAQEMASFPPIMGGGKIDGVVKNFRPGHIIWNALKGGQPQLVPFVGSSNPAPLFNSLGDDENRAANAMFEFDMNLPNRQNMSATEIAERSQQRAAMVAPFAIVTMPSISGQMARHFEITARSGRLGEIPLNVLENGVFQARIDGPLAIAARQAEVLASMQMVDLIAAIDQVPTERIDKDEMTQEVAEASGKAHLLNDPDTMRREREQEAALQEQLLAAQTQQVQADAAQKSTQAIANLNA